MKRKFKSFKGPNIDDVEGKKLVIVESPGKIKKIRGYLGAEYIVMASVGHVMDLPQKRLGIDIKTLAPEYEVYPDKKKIVANLKMVLSKNPDMEVYIASDGDREGEFIGYSLVQLLNPKKYYRIIFHEITKEAILRAIAEKSESLNNNLICAQMCRRIIDRCIGYPISKELSSNVEKAYAAGRVQSVIVKLIYEKCIERDNFITNNLNATNFTCNGNFTINGLNLTGNLIISDLKKNNIVKTNYQTMLLILQTFQTLKQNVKIINVIERQSQIYPDKPFITSTLQQDAYYKYKYSPEKTMLIAQHLYEKGHITYMRTDSPNLSNDVLYQVKQYIIDNFGQEYYKFKQYKSNNNAQEAHEAIRPTHIDVITLNENIGAGDEEQRLYELIWKRTVASQMIPCIMKHKDIIIQYADELKIKELTTHLFHFMGTISTILEPGFKLIYNIERIDEDIDLEVSGVGADVGADIGINTTVTLKEIVAKEQIKTIPTLYNQPNIIKILEKYGIGRPSTFATLLKKIVDYKYVTIGYVTGFKKELREIHMKKGLITYKTKETTLGSEKQKYIITEVGKKATEYLCKKYPMMMDYKFTGDMEKKLDLIAEGKMHYINAIKEFNTTVGIKLK